jgi:hypothetical protein
MGATELSDANLCATDLTDAWSNTACSNGTNTNNEGDVLSAFKANCSTRLVGGRLLRPPVRSRPTRSEWSRPTATPLPIDRPGG